MEAPSGHADLIADVDDEVRRMESALAEKRAEAARLRENGENVGVNEDGEIEDVDKPKPWAHKFMDYKSLTLEVRVPSSQALVALTIATSRHSSDVEQAEYTALFVRNHMSEKSRGELYRRMMDPEDDEFSGEEVMSEILREIAKLGTARPTGRSRR